MGSVTATNRAMGERDYISFGAQAKLSRHGSALRLKKSLSRSKDMTEDYSSQGSLDDARDKRYRLRPGRFVETMNQSLQSPGRFVMHEVARREQQRRIDQENLKLAHQLMHIKHSNQTDHGAMKKGFSRHLKAKALLCKLPIIEMGDNKWSGPNRTNFSRSKRYPIQSSRITMNRIASTHTFDDDATVNEQRIQKMTSK